MSKSVEQLRVEQSQFEPFIPTPLNEHYKKVCSKNMDILIKKNAFQNLKQKVIQDSSPEITSMKILSF